ncbi:MAG: SLC13 family permease [Alphaproteobacteria bacterium]|nr:SLC13 family permease [Alphaproteobacteria bacterium]|tara:strand:- start:144 stop:2003 length:1860 start_codon:yes stop_codon:yes gene_type:complete
MVSVSANILMWITLGIGALTILGYANRRFPLELTSIVILALLLLLFSFAPLNIEQNDKFLDASDLLSGFANPALIAVVGLLVIGQGMIRTGALDAVSELILRISRGSPSLAFAFTLCLALIVSGALNNTPVVIMFIPVLAALAERLGRGVGRIMMPLSFAAILGGMTTLIGSSTNLLVSGTMVELGLQEIGFFDFTIPGLVLAGIGILYVQFIAPRLLPERSLDTKQLHSPSGKQFIAQFTIEDGSELVGQHAIGGFFPAFKDMTVLRLERDGRVVPPPYEDISLKSADVVVIASTRNALSNIVARARWFQISLSGTDEIPSEDENKTDDRIKPGNLMAEAMVSPGSRMVGLPLEQIAFPVAENITVLGIQRRSRMTRGQIHQIRIEAGDVLLLQGRRDGLQRLRANKDVLIMEWSALELRAYHHARRATLIFAAVVVVSAAGIIPIYAAAISGAALMVATGALNIRQAARAIDRQIVLVGATALALTAALTKTGGATYLAEGILSILDGSSPAIILSIFFLMVAIFTNLLSNQACAVLFTPIAVGISVKLGVDPMIFVTAVILAANCSFATPIGYVTNMLVMTPGRYQFMDFVKAGVPLIITLWIGFSLFASWYYGLW